MNRIFTRIIIVLLSFFSLFPRVIAAPITSEVIETFHLYSDFINVAIDELWITHKHLEAFNLQLNHLPQQQSAISGNASAMPVFEVHITPGYEQQYRILIAQSIHLKPESRAILQSKLKDLYDIMGRIRHLAARIEDYSRHENHHSLEDREKGYILLAEMAVLYEDFDIIKGELYFQMEKAYKTYQLPNQKNPYVIAAAELNQLVKLNRKILSALRNDDRRSLQETHQELNRVLGNAVFRQKVLLANMQPRPESSTDPFSRYEAVVFQARALSIFTAEYLSQPKIDPAYRKLGKGYYYYNFRHLNKFSREGQGLVSLYNRFISLSNEPLLKSIGETSLFRPIPPQLVPQSSVQVVENTRDLSQNLVFLLDISGSMDREEKLPVFKQAFAYLLEELKSNDKISLVTYSGEAEVVLPATPVSESAKILRALQTVKVGGESKAEQGFSLAYDQALKNFAHTGNNRVIIISDGGFEIEQSLPKIVEIHAFKTISLDVFYFGQNDQAVRNRLGNLANLGKGIYTHIQAEKAHIQLVEKILGE